jgi:hypothetical protein
MKLVGVAVLALAMLAAGVSAKKAKKEVPAPGDKRPLYNSPYNGALNPSTIPRTYGAGYNPQGFNPSTMYAGQTPGTAPVNDPQHPFNDKAVGGSPFSSFHGHLPDSPEMTMPSGMPAIPSSNYFPNRWGQDGSSPYMPPPGFTRKPDKVDQPGIAVPLGSAGTTPTTKSFLETEEGMKRSPISHPYTPYPVPVQHPTPVHPHPYMAYYNHPNPALAAADASNAAAAVKGAAANMQKQAKAVGNMAAAAAAHHATVVNANVQMWRQHVAAAHARRSFLETQEKYYPVYHHAGMGGGYVHAHPAYHAPYHAMPVHPVAVAQHHANAKAYHEYTAQVAKAHAANAEEHAKYYKKHVEALTASHAAVSKAHAQAYNAAATHHAAIAAAHGHAYNFVLLQLEAKKYAKAGAKAPANGASSMHPLIHNHIQFAKLHGKHAQHIGNLHAQMAKIHAESIASYTKHANKAYEAYTAAHVKSYQAIAKHNAAMLNSEAETLKSLKSPTYPYLHPAGHLAAVPMGVQPYGFVPTSTLIPTTSLLEKSEKVEKKGEYYPYHPYHAMAPLVVPHPGYVAQVHYNAAAQHAHLQQSLAMKQHAAALNAQAIYMKHVSPATYASHASEYYAKHHRQVAAVHDAHAQAHAKALRHLGVTSFLELPGLYAGIYHHIALPGSGVAPYAPASGFAPLPVNANAVDSRHASFLPAANYLPAHVEAMKKMDQANGDMAAAAKTRNTALQDAHFRAVKAPFGTKPFFSAFPHPAVAMHPAAYANSFIPATYPGGMHPAMPALPHPLAMSPLNAAAYGAAGLHRGAPYLPLLSHPYAANMGLYHPAPLMASALDSRHASFVPAANYLPAHVQAMKTMDKANADVAAAAKQRDTALQDAHFRAVKAPFGVQPAHPLGLMATSAHHPISAFGHGLIPASVPMALIDESSGYGGEAGAPGAGAPDAAAAAAALGGEAVVENPEEITEKAPLPAPAAAGSVNSTFNPYKHVQKTHERYIAHMHKHAKNQIDLAKANNDALASYQADHNNAEEAYQQAQAKQLSAPWVPYNPSLGVPEYVAAQNAAILKLHKSRNEANAKFHEEHLEDLEDLNEEQGKANSEWQQQAMYPPMMYPYGNGMSAMGMPMSPMMQMPAMRMPMAMPMAMGMPRMAMPRMAMPQAPMMPMMPLTYGAHPGFGMYHHSAYHSHPAVIKESHSVESHKILPAAWQMTPQFPTPRRSVHEAFPSTKSFAKRAEDSLDTLNQELENSKLDDTTVDTPILDKTLNSVDAQVHNAHETAMKKTGQVAHGPPRQARGHRK